MRFFKLRELTENGRVRQAVPGTSFYQPRSILCNFLSPTWLTIERNALSYIIAIQTFLV